MEGLDDDEPFTTGLKWALKTIASREHAATTSVQQIPLITICGKLASNLTRGAQELGLQNIALLEGGADSAEITRTLDKKQPQYERGTKQIKLGSPQQSGITIVTTDPLKTIQPNHQAIRQISRQLSDRILYENRVPLSLVRKNCSTTTSVVSTSLSITETITDRNWISTGAPSPPNSNTIHRTTEILVSRVTSGYFRQIRKEGYIKYCTNFKRSSHHWTLNRQRRRAFHCADHISDSDLSAEEESNTMRLTEFSTFDGVPVRKNHVMVNCLRNLICLNCFEGLF